MVATYQEINGTTVHVVCMHGLNKTVNFVTIKTVAEVPASKREARPALRSLKKRPSCLLYPVNTNLLPLKMHASCLRTSH